MAIAATIAVDIVARTQAFQKAMGDLSDRLDRVGKNISATGQTLTGAFTVPLAAATAGIYKAVQAAADLEETQNAVGVVFGDTTPQILEFAQTAATSLGQSTEEALRAAQTFGMFGKAAGLSGQETVQFSTDLVRLAADFASIQNTSPEEAINAIGSALRGEAEPIRRFNVLLDEYTLKQKAMEMGIVATTKNALTPQQKILAAHSLILEQGSYAAGDFERTSGGLANQQRILTAELSNAAAQLGQAFLPIALQLVTVVRDRLVPAIVSLSNFMGSLSPAVLETGIALGAFLAAAGPVLMVIGQIVQVGGMLAGALSAPVAALAALGAAMVVIYTRSETFREIVNSLIGKLVELVKTVSGVVIGSLTSVANVIVTVGEKVVSVADRFGLLPDRVRSAVDTAKQIISELRAPSLDLGVTGSNAAAVDALYGPVMEASKTVATGFTVDFGKVRDALGESTIAVKENTLTFTPMKDAMERQIQQTQSQARVLMDAQDRQRDLDEQVERTTLAMGETTMAYDVLMGAMDLFGQANDTAKQRLGGVANSALDMVSKFTPMGIIVEMLSEALEYLMPVVESLMEPFKIIGLVLGKALASILRALFPIIKMVAIAFTYAGQIFFKVAELIAKAIGYAVYGIGKAIDAIPMVSAKKVINAGKALIDIGEGFGQAYKDLGNAREEIKGLELPDEKEKEAMELTKQSTDANKETAANTMKIAALLEEQKKQPRVQVVINGGGTGGGGTDANADIIRKLDDYFGRAAVFEERALGRVGSFGS